MRVFFCKYGMGSDFFIFCSMRLRFLFLLMFAGLSLQAQTDKTDVRYLEDQFYLGLTYNFLSNIPSQEFIQRNLSYGFFVGIIKDIPFNQNRNFGMGLGLGYSTNSYYSNLVVSQSGSDLNYQIIVDGQLDYDRSKIETHGIELPLEVRWRTSNADSYKFWRVYTGIKATYLFSTRSKLVSNDATLNFHNSDVLRLQYGAILNFGYNTWNIHFYYGLNHLLDGVDTVDGVDLTLFPIRVGLVFYIL